jgi:hypothetical protein
MSVGSLIDSSMRPLHRVNGHVCDYAHDHVILRPSTLQPVITLWARHLSNFAVGASGHFVPLTDPQIVLTGIAFHAVVALAHHRTVTMTVVVALIGYRTSAK